MKLWHCYNARSLRPLWALEEMGMDYDLKTMVFPPRFTEEDYLSINNLGTIPYFIDGDTHMTESSAIGHYLVDRYGRFDFGLRADHVEYGDYLNWMYHSDATLTFPQTVMLRYGIFEKKKGLTQAGVEYGEWFIARLVRVDEHLAGGRDYLVDGRFTVADIAIGYALHLGDLIGLSKDYSPRITEYLNRLRARPAFIRCQSYDADLNAFK